MKKSGKVAIGLGVFFVLACGVSSVASSMADHKKEAATFHTPDSSAAAGQAAGGTGKKVLESPAPGKSKTGSATINDGTWDVGVEVGAGRYKTVGASPAIYRLCYWEVREDSEQGEIVTIGSVEGEKEPARVTLRKGDFFKTTGCEPWVKVS